MTQSENSPLQHTVTHHPTDYWNDSCAIEELTYAIHHGAVGATTNPSIELNVLKQEMHLWQDRIEAIIAENPAWSESQITWKLVEEMAVHGARLLEPAYHRHKGKKGRREQMDIDPSFLACAEIATFEKAYLIFRKRGYRSRLLAAAYRHLGHWSELIGGDIVLTIPCEWARKINSSDIPVISGIEAAAPSECVRALYSKIPDFRRAYDEDGLRPEEFDGFGATVRTLRSFIESVHDLNALVRDFMLPNPDLKR